MAATIPGYIMRPATPEDIPAIHNLMLEMAEFEKLTDIFKATHESLFNSFFSPSPAANCLVITTEDDPQTAISYIMWFHNYSSFLDKKGLYLEDVYISPHHRHKGLGGWVLKHLAQKAIELDCGRFEWVVLNWNKNAIDFYKHHGGEILDDWSIVRVTGSALHKLANS